MPFRTTLTSSSRRVRALVPEPIKPPLRRGLDVFDPIAVAAYRRRSGFAGPVPPRRLRARIGEPDVARFLAHGEAAARALGEAATGAAMSLDAASEILDFGCGCGRVLRPILEARGGRLRMAGCDVDDEAITWLRGAYVGRGVFEVNDFSPPLPFEDGRFDIVYSVSIFTHLGPGSHEAWLEELARVVVNGGLALLSIHGEHAYAGARRGEQSGIARDLSDRLRAHESLPVEGFVFEPYETRVESRDLRGISGDYGLTFQSEDQVRRDWTKWFEVLEIRTRAINNWQDLVVLRRR